MLETQAKDVEASIEEATIDPSFALGQRVTQKDKGYKGVVFGWDVLCCETDEWKQKNSVETLKNGVEQIFYHVRKFTFL